MTRTTTTTTTKAKAKARARTVELRSRCECEYDSAGNLVRTVDEWGHEERWAYDSTGTVIRYEDSDGADYWYDAAGNRIEVADRVLLDASGILLAAIFLARTLPSLFPCAVTEGIAEVATTLGYPVLGLVLVFLGIAAIRNYLVLRARKAEYAGLGGSDGN